MYKLLLIMVLCICGCSQSISPTAYKNAEEVCSNNGGVEKIIIDGDGSGILKDILTIKCVNGMIKKDVIDSNNYKGRK